ncbi:MAG: alpha/beta hydrolase [Bdellovibrio sp.]
MKITIHFISQGRMLEGSLYMFELNKGPVPGLLFEGSMTGATQQVTEFLARETSRHGFACLVMDHSYYGEDETATAPWESPSKRKQDIKEALDYLMHHVDVERDKIAGVGVSVGAEFLAEASRETPIMKGLVLIQGVFDDAEKVAERVDVPTFIVDETHLDAAVDETVEWIEKLFRGGVPEKGAGQAVVDWSQMDE